MSAEDDLRLYFDTFYGYEGAHGWLHAATGDPCLTDAGRIEHENWTQYSFEWPAGEFEPVILAATLDEAVEHDVFIGPYLMSSRGRHKGCSTDRWFAHSEVDDDLDLDKVEEVGGFAVGSGSPGHGHVYVGLSRSVDGYEHRALCYCLKRHFGAKDSKVSDNDLLRAPGTFNHKPATRGEPPAPVTWLVRPSGVLVEPEALGATFGVDLSQPSFMWPWSDWTSSDTRRRGGRGGGPGFEAETELVPGLRAWYPRVWTALKRRTETGDPYKDTDRSVDTMRIVGACVDAGLTLPQTRWVVNQRDDLAERIEARHDDEVLRCFAKITADRDERRQEQGWVESSRRNKRAAWSKGRRS